MRMSVLRHQESWVHGVVRRATRRHCENDLRSTICDPPLPLFRRDITAGRATRRFKCVANGPSMGYVLGGRIGNGPHQKGRLRVLSFSPRLHPRTPVPRPLP